jgi:predicted flap endonuclease-1-like 5' DNA nuclease
MGLTNEMRQLTENLLGAHGERVAAVAGIRTSTAQELADFHAAQQEMSAEQRARMAELLARLGAQRDGLASETRAFVQAADAAQQQKAADHGDARQAWSSFAELMQERRSKGQAAPASIAPPPAPAPPPALLVTATPSRSGGDRPRAPAARVQAAASDDLTAISGIGVGMKQRLNQGGIRSFAQLAHSTPEELREVLGNAGRLAKVNNWIKEAQDLLK